MSKIDNLIKRIGNLQNKLQERKLQELWEVPKVFESSTKETYLEDHQTIMCPVCSELLDDPAEGQLEPNREKWAYIEATCPNCGTSFRIGEVPYRCSLCQDTFRTHPGYDINEFNHHYCEKDGQEYCTPCFMQLFFDGYIDLSSNSLMLNCDTPKIIAFPLLTYVGHSLDVYRSRLKAGGFEEIITSKEWDDVEKVCLNIVFEGHRYLILSIRNSESEDIEHIVYMKRL